MSYKLIVQFKDSVSQESIDSILESPELKKARWGSGLKAEKMFDLPLDCSSEALGRLARSYEFDQNTEGVQLKNSELLHFLKNIKEYFELFDEVYFIQIETQNAPIAIFKNYSVTPQPERVEEEI